jgi:hypothetical protein
MLELESSSSEREEERDEEAEEEDEADDELPYDRPTLLSDSPLSASLAAPASPAADEPAATDAVDPRGVGVSRMLLGREFRSAYASRTLMRLGLRSSPGSAIRCLPSSHRRSLMV